MIAETGLDIWCYLSSSSYNQFRLSTETVDIMKGIETMLEDKNPLFWLFQMQEQSLLTYKQNELKKNGFALLQE